MRYATGKMNKNIYVFVRVCAWTGVRERDLGEEAKRNGSAGDSMTHAHTTDKAKREKSRAKKGTLILISCRLNTRKLNQ